MIIIAIVITLAIIIKIDYIKQLITPALVSSHEVCGSYYLSYVLFVYEDKDEDDNNDFDDDEEEGRSRSAREEEEQKDVHHFYIASE